MNDGHLEQFIQDLARTAGRIQMEKRGKLLELRSKSGRGDLVTEVDEECEGVLISQIKQKRPRAAIVSEEAGTYGDEDAEEVWIIDPLDGTRNYVVGVPFFCVSIAVARIVGSSSKPRFGQCRVGAGAIYDPVHDEMFLALRGRGAYLNGSAIRVSTDRSLDDGIVSIAWVKQKAERGKFVQYIDDISRETSYFRRFGSAALMMAYVGCGRVNAYIQGGLNPWDVAAGICLVEEAGGVVTDFSGTPVNLGNQNIELVAANPVLHSLLLQEVINKPRGS